MANITGWLNPGRAFDAPTGLNPGTPVNITPGAGTTHVLVEKPDESIWITEVGEEAVIFAETEQPGLYQVSLRDTNGDQPAGSFAVNLFSTAESTIGPAPAIILGQTAVETADEGDVGQRELWPWLAALAFIVLLVEWWVYHRGTRLPRWLIILTVPLLLLAACSQRGGLRPIAPTVVSDPIIASQPQLVTFSELEADPSVYQNKVIRVTGTYLPLPVVACSPQSGPITRWALVAQDLRLDMLGFEGLLNQLAPQDLTLTLDGILRRYDGPLGCGKRPATGILWYLEVFQIIQPNPLVQAGVGPSGGTSIIPPPFPTGTPLGPDSEATPQEEATTGPGTVTSSSSPTTAVVGTASSTPTITADQSLTPQSTATVSRTPTRTTTPTLSPTTGPGGSTPTPSQTPTAGATSLPLPTATPVGYPGPTAFPTASPYP